MNAKNGKKITLIGCGNLGSALLKRWDEFTDFDFAVVKPSRLGSDLSHIRYFATLAEAKDRLQESDLIVLAIKPQIMSEVCSELAPLIIEENPVLSLAAGIKIEKIETYFSSNWPITRGMPNTPVSTGKGATICAANKNVETPTKDLINTLFQTTGFNDWIEDENLIEVVTALSGSGPAYLYYFTEVLAKCGHDLGLDARLSQRLALQTFIGAAELADKSGNNVITLRDNVTSKGGVTAKALEILTDGRFEEIMKEALEANLIRAKELNS